MSANIEPIGCESQVHAPPPVASQHSAAAAPVESETKIGSGSPVLTTVTPTILPTETSQSQPDSPPVIDGNNPPYLQPTIDHTTQPSTLLNMGIPSFHPSAFHPDRSYNYEKKYPLHPLADGEKVDPDARIWKVYMDEAEIYDNDMLKAFRDTIDSMLVFAALFSAVVTTFAVQTSAALKPDYAELSAMLMYEQLQLTRAGGNVTSMNNIPETIPLGGTIHVITSSNLDVWVNAFFFTSLTLALATALISVLIKQWLQAYTSLISGDVMERCLVRQLRFSGLQTWKLPQLIALLPLLLHLSLAIFLVGLSLFALTLDDVIAILIILITSSTFALYFLSVLLAEIWLQCPYRIPVFHYILQFLAFLVNFMFRHTQYIALKVVDVVSDCILPFTSSSFLQTPILDNYITPKLEFRSFRNLEQQRLNSKHTPTGIKPIFREIITADSLCWLFQESTNSSVRKIATNAVGSFLCPNPASRRPPTTHPAILPRLPLDEMDEVCKDIVFASFNANRPIISLSGFLGYLVHLFQNPNTNQFAIAHPSVGRVLYRAIVEKKIDVIKFLLDKGFPVNTSLNFRDMNKIVLGKEVSPIETLLYTASLAGQIGLVHILLDHGADVNMTMPSTRKTALHAATSQDRVATMELLLKCQDTKVDIADASGQTPLHIAAKACSLPAVNLLLSYKADTRLRRNDDSLPLQLAISSHMLFECGDNVGEQAQLIQSLAHGLDATIIQQCLSKLIRRVESSASFHVEESKTAGVGREVALALLKGGAKLDILPEGERENPVNLATRVLGENHAVTKALKENTESKV